MKVNMMIKRALASSVAATMMLGGAVVMADETDDELEMTPVIVCTAAEEEPEAETIDEEQTDDAAYHTGDIIYITNESTSFSDGVYRVYISSLDYTTFTNCSFYKKNGQLIMSRGGISISLGSGYAGFRTIVSDNGSVELHPVTQQQIDTLYTPVEVTPADTTPVVDELTETPTENSSYEAPDADTFASETPAIEEANEGPFHEGEILYATSETTVLPEGESYSVYVTAFGCLNCTRGSFYLFNGNLMFNRNGFAVKVGKYVGYRVTINDNGGYVLRPVTNADIEMYAASDAARQREMEEQLPTIDEYSIEEEAPADEQVPTVDVTPIVNVTLPPVVSTRPSAPAVSAAPAAAATLVATQSGTEGFVNRLYTSALGREADPTGFAHWVNILNSKELTGTEVANGFFNSAEFASRDLNNVEFVTVLYRVFFDREPDHNGLNYWVRSLQNGMTRQQVIAGFTGSSEWADTCAEFGIIA